MSQQNSATTRSHAMPDQNCGACRWWKHRHNNVVLGDCSYPMPLLPDSVVSEYLDREAMHASEGRRCPCFERREEGRETL